MSLVEHYSNSLRATYMGQVSMAYRMFVDEDAARWILSEYTLKEDV